MAGQSGGLRELPTSAQRFVLAVIGLAAAVAAASALATSWTWLGVRDPLFFAAATAVFGIYGVVVIHHKGQGIEITSDNAWTLAAAIVFPPNLAFLIALVGYLPHQIARRCPCFKAGFNMAQAGLSAAATSQT